MIAIQVASTSYPVQALFHMGRWLVQIVDIVNGVPCFRSEFGCYEHETLDGALRLLEASIIESVNRHE